MTIYFGAIQNNEVTGQKIELTNKSNSDFLHKKYNYPYTYKWRFNIETKELFCWEPLNDLQVDLIKDWLDKRGENVLEFYYTRWGKNIQELTRAAEIKKSKAKIDTWENLVRKHHILSGD